MIEKILDNYYSKKLCMLIKDISKKWDLDKKTIIKKDTVKFLVKLKEYNDEQYKSLITVPKKEVFIYLCDYKMCVEDIENSIKNYIKYVKGEE